MDYKLFETFVKDHCYSWVEYQGNKYYVREDADEDNWLTFLMIEETADVNDWTYAITCSVTRDEDGDIDEIVEVIDVEEA